ncbi:MAG: ATP-binding protein, partial [Rudaea sp.]
LGLELRTQTPAAQSPRLPFMRDLAQQLAQRLPVRDLRLVETPRPILWVAAQPGNDGWIGIPLLRLRGPLRWTTNVALLAGMLLVFAAAAWYARSLVRPLHALAQAAPGLLAGEPAPSMPRHTVREIADLANALNAAAAQTRSAAHERQLMLAGLSHDMRTPLARLVLALELLDAGDRAIRDGMTADIAELDAILDQFVAYVRDGRDEPGGNTDVGALLDEALAAQGRAGREWQRLGDAQAMMYAKPLALRRAIGNLLENAARHGAAPFEAELRRFDTGISLSVRDRGEGVSEDVLTRLGRPFYRADEARGSPGTGLGLATVARIAAWHGGTLVLSNRADGGFEATLRLIAARV